MAVGITVRSSPGASTSTMNREQRPCRSGVALAGAGDDEERVAISTPEMKTLVPRSRQPPSSVRVACVARLCVLVPASGSVMAKAMRRSPRPMPRSQRSRCSGEPCRASTLPAIAGETRMSSSGVAREGELLAHRGQRRHPQAAAVVLGGDVDAQVAGGGQLVPQLDRGPLLLRAALHVVAAVAVRDDRDGLADPLLLLGGNERVGGGPGRQAHAGSLSADHFSSAVKIREKRLLPSDQSPRTVWSFTQKPAALAFPVALNAPWARGMLEKRRLSPAVKSVTLSALASTLKVIVLWSSSLPSYAPGLGSTFGWLK